MMLVRKEESLLHAGGTAIPKGRLSKAESVIDLSHLGWDFCKKEDKTIDFGAMATFSDILRFMSKIDENHVLVRALGGAASTQQRNRITIGGSVAFSPLWSDLIGPLVALGASVELVGPHCGIYPLFDYISKKSIFKGSIVKKVSIPVEAWQAWYYREVRVGFDYPGFTITLLSKRGGVKMTSLRAVVVGTRERLSVLTDLEKKLSGVKCSDIDVAGIGKTIKLDFPDKKSGSSSYFEQVAPVWIERGLSDLLER